MNKKSLLATFILTSILYYIIPLIFLKFYSGSSDKAGFILMLFYIFSAFSIIMLISYFIERKIYIPVFSIILSIPLIYVFNSSAFVIIILIAIFSFLSYGLSAILK